MAIGTPYDLGGTQNKTSGTSTSFTTTAAIAAGDTVFVAPDMGGSTTGIVTAVSVGGNALTKVADVASGSCSTSLWVLQNAPAIASGATVSLTHSSTATKAVAAWACSGLSASGTILSATGTSGSGSVATIASPGTVTTGDSNYLLVGVVGYANVSPLTMTQPSGFLSATSPYGPPTSIGTSGGGATAQRSLQGGYNISPAAGTYSYAPTLSSSSSQAAIIAAIPGATGGASGPVGELIMLSQARVRAAFW